MKRVLITLALLLLASSASAVDTIVQDPTLAKAAASTVDITFASLPTSGSKIIVAFTTRGAGAGFTPNVPAQVSDNQGSTFTQVVVNTSDGAGAAAIAHTNIGSTSGSYTVTITVSGATHIVAKAWEVSGLDTAASAAPRSIPCQGSDHYVNSSRIVTNQTGGAVTATAGGLRALTTGATSFLVAVARIQSPTSLAHLNTGGGWSRCTGCPETDDSASVGTDIVYQLSAPAGVYDDAWTFSVPAGATRHWGTLIGSCDAAP